jgi:hypothetical protein
MVKVKVPYNRPWRAQRGIRGIASLIRDLGTEMGWVVSTTPQPLYSREDPVPIVQEAGSAPGPVWMCTKNLTPTRIRSPDHPARGQSLYRLSYPSPCFMVHMVNFHKTLKCWTTLCAHLLCQIPQTGQWMCKVWTEIWGNSWVRHSVTYWKYMGFIPGICHCHNHSSRSMALESTQPLTEMSTRNISGGKKVASAYGWQPYHLPVLTSEIWEPQHPETLRASPGLHRDYFTFYRQKFMFTPK